MIRKNVIDPLMAWVSYGTEFYQGPAKRRILITNMLVTLVSIMTVPYVIFLSFYDFRGLVIPIITFAIACPMFLVTPFLHRWSAYAGGLYNLSLWVAFSLSISYFFSAQSGIHFYLLAGATNAIAVFGVRQNFLSIISICYGIAGFMYADRYFTEPAPFLDLDPQLLNVLYFTSIPLALAVIFWMVFYAFLQLNRAETLLQKEYDYSERLLANMLPKAIASQLKRNPGQTIANSHDSVTILFSDIVDFTPKSHKMTADQVVKFLNQLFTRFDVLATKHKLEKIKTLGDAFMVAGGMPETQPDHGERVARLALDMIKATDTFSKEFGEKIELRIGVHSGPVVAGVIGTTKPVYDVWGDTVNTAARLESFGTDGQIQVTKETKESLERDFKFKKRGKVNIKGKGELETWYLVGVK